MSTPSSPPSGRAERLFPEPPAESKFLAVKTQTMKTGLSLRAWSALVPLVLAPPLAADITVTGSGTITITHSAAVHFSGSTLRITDSAEVRIHSGGNLTGSTVEIAPLAKLYNCGTVNAAVVNQGEVVADCGGTSTFLAAVANYGVFRASHGSLLVVAGSFQNNPGALLDLITADQTGPPLLLSNAGTLIKATDVRVAGIEIGPVDAKITIQGIRPHTYRLLGSNNLNAGPWAQIGPVKIATGGLLQFDHPGVLPDFDKYFYRIAVGDQ
jgi:hypothetical protein